jgi:hypothetical protein
LCHRRQATADRIASDFVVHHQATSSNKVFIVRVNRP